MRMSKSLALTLAAVLVACEGGAGPQMSHVFVRLTDTPAGITSAHAWISTVYLIGGDGTSRDTISTGPSTEYDLLALQGGVTALLGDNTIPAGDYEQLRLVVDSAFVVLDGETDRRILKIPSGMQSGIKVEWNGPVHIEPGRTDLTIDFDVSRSFIITGPTPPRQVLFKPVLHGVVTDLSGSISGTSSPAAALGRVFAIDGTDTVGTADADPNTGAYQITFLPAATYTVLDSSTASGHKAPTQSVTVAAGQNVTGVDFTIP